MSEDIMPQLRAAAATPPGGVRTLMDCTLPAWAADEIALLRALLARWLVECDPNTGNLVDLFEDTEDALQSAKQD